ncbi:MAG: DUF86 domain-containing protein [bacterium]
MALKFNETKIKERLYVIERERSSLDDYIGIDYIDFFSEDDKQTGIRYYACLHSVQLALQAVLDISAHIAAKNLFGKYKENKELVLLMARNGVIPKELAQRLAKAVGTRNILVHHYVEVNPEIIFHLVQNDLGDLDQFVKEIEVKLGVKSKNLG